MKLRLYSVSVILITFTVSFSVAEDAMVTDEVMAAGGFAHLAVDEENGMFLFFRISLCSQFVSSESEDAVSPHYASIGHVACDKMAIFALCSFDHFLACDGQRSC